MSKKWLVVEDNAKRAAALITALGRNVEDGDTILCIWPNSDAETVESTILEKSNTINNNAKYNANSNTEFVNNIESLKNIIKKEVDEFGGDIIFIFDQVLEGVGDMRHDTDGDFWRYILHHSERVNVVHLYSTLRTRAEWRGDIYNCVDNEYEDHVSTSDTALGDDVDEAAPEIVREAKHTWQKNTRSIDASRWSAAKWMELRAKAWEVCCAFGGPSKAHHLPNGGIGVEEPVKSSLPDRLREELSGIGGATIYQLPDYSWGKGDGELDAWDRPPIRAIAQFDPDGHDLSLVLRLVEREVVRKIDNVDLGVTFQPPTFEHDYLWFNACALSRGLCCLAESFSHEVSKSEPYVEFDADRGRINWHIHEDEKGLRVMVNQVKLREGREEGDAQLSPKTLELPSEDSATGQVERAYRFFKNAGAQTLKQDGSLLIQVPSQVHSKDHPLVWQLKES